MMSLNNTSRIALGMIVVLSGIVAVSQVWATDWPASEDPVNQYKNIICAKQSGYGGGSCTGIDTCTSRTLAECTQYSYMFRKDKRDYGLCSTPSLGATCTTYGGFYCALINSSTYMNCDPPADDCSAWIIIGPDICNPTL